MIFNLPVGLSKQSNQRLALHPTEKCRSECTTAFAGLTAGQVMLRIYVISASSTGCCLLVKGIDSLLVLFK